MRLASVADADPPAAYAGPSAPTPAFVCAQDSIVPLRPLSFLRQPAYRPDPGIRTIETTKPAGIQECPPLKHIPAAGILIVNRSTAKMKFLVCCDHSK
ncbi:hypothetical protein [Bifidobacterium sp. ESL0704]|uniref:hypothetical protein n=1 Tax=Bifidobacterium sp. ESL0704 TaxID=2983219 RepID=UPI0023F9A629|nr:hypothetical protein [Bifidobacterium sp. ESL0704]WEV53289.1 hypothetical protein OZX64_02000 [Bifidobacterium sp. ESL0704]